MSDLIKNLKITENAHSALVEACEARFGTRKVRFSDAIKQMSEDTIRRERGDGDE